MLARCKSATTLRWKGKTLSGNEVEFRLSDIVSVYPDDAVIYVKTNIGTVPLDLNSVIPGSEYHG